MKIPDKFLKKLPERFIIAYDEGRYHIRETLCVGHNFINGEVTYDALPLGSGDTLEKALKEAIKFYKEK